MANIEVKLRRGTDTEHSSFTGAEGEVTVDTTNDTLRVHDGSTAGGIRLAKLSEVSGGTGTVTEVDAGTGLETNPVSGIVGTGTIGISDGGVGTTQLANDAVTFAKMQDINTAKVIGRTTVGSGNPEEVSILDEDAMTSNSATALATQQSIKAYVDAQIGGWNFTNQTVSSTLSPPNTFTDLDLSSFVGTNSAYVIFEASGNTGGYSLNLNFRKKGSTYDVAGSVDKNITGSGIGYQLFGITDSSGVIQYRQSNVTGTGTITLKIIAYVK